MKIQTTWVFGNFKVSAATEVETAEPVGPVAAALMEKGFLQLLQRVPASNAEKAVAGEGWTKNSKGTPQRPKDFKRDSIAWSEETALVLAEGFGKDVEVSEGVKLAFSVVEVVEHVGAEAVNPLAQATMMATTLRAQGAAAAPMLAVLKMTTESTDAELIEACSGFLKGMIRKK